MKKGIHPEYKDCTVTCACGATYNVKSTSDNMVIEVCSNCHPFYTGKQNRGIKAGRIEKFNKKYGFESDSKAA